MERFARYECDLHTHSTISDGQDTPVELIDNAAAAGLKVLLLCDHDKIPVSVYRGASLTDYAADKGVVLLHGVELSCETEIEDTHIILIGGSFCSAAMREMERSIEQSKIDGYRILVERIASRGFDMSWDELLDNNGSPIRESDVQKKQIFELAARKGFADDWGTAKLKIKRDGELSVKRAKPSAKAVITASRQSGCLSILAHPFLISGEVNYNGALITREDFILRLKEEGLGGIEASYTYDKTSYDGGLSPDNAESEIRRKYADMFSVVSGGSDYHADHKKGVKNARLLGERGITLDYFINNGHLLSKVPRQAMRALQ